MNMLPFNLSCLAFGLAVVAVPAHKPAPVLPAAVKFADNGGQYAWLTKGDCFIGANIQEIQDGHAVYISLESNTKDTKSGFPEVAIVADPDGKSYLQVANKDSVERVNLNDAVRVLKKLIAAEAQNSQADE